MKLVRVACAALAFAAVSPAFASDAQTADFEAQCKGYATEDGVKPEEMDDYMRDCVADMVEAAKSAGD